MRDTLSKIVSLLAVAVSKVEEEAANAGAADLKVLAEQLVVAASAGDHKQLLDLAKKIVAICEAMSGMGEPVAPAEGAEMSADDLKGYDEAERTEEEVVEEAKRLVATAKGFAGARALRGYARGLSHAVKAASFAVPAPKVPIYRDPAQLSPSDVGEPQRVSPAAAADGTARPTSPVPAAKVDKGLADLERAAKAAGKPGWQGWPADFSYLRRRQGARR